MQTEDKQFSVFDIVMKLVGAIHPVGESNYDAQAHENLKEMICLVDDLILELHRVAKNETRHEASMLLCGQEARKYLNTIALEFGQNEK